MSRKIAVCIPAYNGEKYLERAVSSCKPSENPWLEIFVSDNASNDATPNICRKLAKQFSNFRYERFEEHVSAMGNFRRCIQSCVSELIIFVCCDDLIVPEGLKKAFEEFEKDPELGFVCCPVLCVQSDGRSFRQLPTGSLEYRRSSGLTALEKHELIADGVSVPGFLARRDLYLRTSCYEEDVELLTEFFCPHLLSKESEFVVTNQESGIFLPRGDSNYSGRMAEKVVSDFSHSLQKIESEFPDMRSSRVICSSLENNLVRNIVKRGPLSIRQSILLIQLFRRCFKRTPTALLLGTLAVFFLGTGEGWRMKLIRRMRFRKFSIGEELCSATSSHCREFVPYFEKNENVN